MYNKMSISEENDMELLLLKCIFIFLQHFNYISYEEEV